MTGKQPSTIMSSSLLLPSLVPMLTVFATVVIRKIVEGGWRQHHFLVGTQLAFSGLSVSLIGVANRLVDSSAQEKAFWEQVVVIFPIGLLFMFFVAVSIEQDYHSVTRNVWKIILLMTSNVVGFSLLAAAVALLQL